MRIAHGYGFAGLLRESVVLCRAPTLICNGHPGSEVIWNQMSASARIPPTELRTRLSQLTPHASIWSRLMSFAATAILAVVKICFVYMKLKVSLLRQLRRRQVAKLFSNLPPCPIGIDACASRRFWGADCLSWPLGQANGGLVTKPCLKPTKITRADTEATRKAVARPISEFCCN
jgi:hypothetical protein